MGAMSGFAAGENKLGFSQTDQAMWEREVREVVKVSGLLVFDALFNRSVLGWMGPFMLRPTIIN